MCIGCLSFCCCCRPKNSEKSSCRYWFSGRFKKVDEINGSTRSTTEISTTEIITIEQRRSAPNIEQRQSQKSVTVTNNATASFKESPRDSNFSDSTFGDVSFIDVRLDLFEEDRFRDISEAIFKKHSECSLT